MYDFTNEYICLILTCNKPQYKERLNSHTHIYSQIRNAGFEIIFLYADANITDIHIKQSENGYYTMTVPTEESYTNLAVKMYIAYSFFAAQDIKGILKVDDDVYYIEDECLDLDYYHVDYLGICAHSITNFCNSIHSRTYRKDKFKDVPIAVNTSNISSYKYFYVGNLYWVSKKAIMYVANCTWSPEFIGASEDLFIGLSLADKSDIKRFDTNWKFLERVKVLEGLGI